MTAHRRVRLVYDCRCAPEARRIGVEGAAIVCDRCGTPLVREVTADGAPRPVAEGTK